MKYNPKPQIYPKVVRVANPEYKEDYEMPADYQRQAEQMVELIESREEYARIMPTLPPEARREAMPHYQKLCRSVDELEEKMAYEYERYQEERRREQELSELTWLDEPMSEEHFIRVKHQRPYIFEEFAEDVMDGMTGEEREEHNRIIARREAEELEDILSGKINAPEYENLFIKHLLPDEWMPEQLLRITLLAYKTDHFFKGGLESLERGIDTRRDFTFELDRALPVRRRNMEERSIELKKELDAGKLFLLNYVEECKKNGKFSLLDEHYVEKLDKLFTTLEENRARKYVVLKHTMPERLDEYARIVTEDFTPEETEAFFKQVAASEENSLSALMHSLENERQAIEIVEARRAAGVKKVAGPEPTQSDKAKHTNTNYTKLPDDAPKGKPAYDLPERYARNLRAYYAITSDDIEPVHYMDELDELFESMARNAERLYIIIKHQTPHLFDEFHKIATDYMDDEELHDFYARIAHLEATQLDDILEGKE